jgi:anti-anti-sigma factor
MALDITVTQQHLASGTPSSTVRLVGSLDLAALSRASPVLAGLVATRPSLVVLDLARLSFVDSSGISLLLKTRLDLEAQGGQVLVTNVQPPVAKVFAIVQALPASTVFRDTQEMDAYLRVMQQRDGADG